MTKDIQDLYSVNHKTLLAEIKENLNKLRNIPCYELIDLILLKCKFSPN